MQININAQDIERLVQDELIKAGLGKVISEAVQKTLQSGYNNPIDDAIKRYVLGVAERMLREMFAEQLDAAIAEAVKKHITTDAANKLIESTITKMVRAAESNY
jgi:hypothetical protein